jgi:hypothetical protein
MSGLIDKSRRYVERIDLFATPSHVHLEAIHVRTPEGRPVIIVLSVSPRHSMSELVSQDERGEVLPQALVYPNQVATIVPLCGSECTNHPIDRTHCNLHVREAFA